MKLRHLAFLLFTVFFWVSSSNAQNDLDTEGVSEVELQLQKEDPKPRDVPPLSPAKDMQQVDYGAIKSVTPYSDLAVVQKSYMRKSKRIQVNGGLTLVPNDIFYNTFGLDGKIGYHFNETWGVELQYIYLNSSKARVTEDLESEQQTSVQNLVNLKSFYGANIYFNSMYGKTTLWDKQIIPFEVYQTIGFGKVDTGQPEASTALRLGIGELFTINKSRALRVDLSVLFFKSKNILGSEDSNNSIFLTVSLEQFITGKEER